METYARELIPRLLEIRPDLELTAFVNREVAEIGRDPYYELVPSVVVPVYAQSRVQWVRGEQQSGAAMTDRGLFESQSLIGEPNRVECDDRGCRIADDDRPTLQLKSGEKIDLVAVDELAGELFGLPRERFTIELWSPAELHQVQDRPTLGVHLHDDDANFSLIGLDENLTGREAAEVLGHELTHATHADALFGGGSPTVAHAVSGGGSTAGQGRPAIVLARGHQADSEHLRPAASRPLRRRLPSDPARNWFDTESTTLEQRDGRRAPGPAPVGLGRALPQPHPGDRYLRPTRCFEGADVLHSQGLGFWYGMQAAKRKHRPGYKLVLTIWETIPSAIRTETCGPGPTESSCLSAPEGTPGCASRRCSAKARGRARALQRRSAAEGAGDRVRARGATAASLRARPRDRRRGRDPPNGSVRRDA